MENNLYVHQLFEEESSTYTYLLADKESKEAIIIDSVQETYERDLKLLEELGFTLKYIIETHVHADHITAAAKLHEKTGAKIVLGKSSGVESADILLVEGEELHFGSMTIKALLTPGHTNGCTSYSIANILFTGDTLLVRSVGRTDFQQGDSATLYDSVQKLFSYPDDTVVYPGHNYAGISQSSIGEEKTYNKFVREELPKEESINLMEKRELSLPKKIEESVPANMMCGRL